MFTNHTEHSRQNLNHIDELKVMSLWICTREWSLFKTLRRPIIRTRLTNTVWTNIQDPRGSSLLRRLVRGGSVLAVLGDLVAGALRRFLLVSRQKGFDFRRDLPLIHGQTPLLVLRTQQHRDVRDWFRESIPHRCFRFFYVIHESLEEHVHMISMWAGHKADRN